MGHPLLPYDIAMLPSSLLRDWEPSPFQFSQAKALGLVKSKTLAWRAAAGRGTVQIASFNHPRAITLDLQGMLFAMVENIVWLQRLNIESKQTGRLQVPGATAQSLTIKLAGGVGLPLVAQARATLHALAWKTRGVNDFLYVGVAGEEMEDSVLKKFPAAIVYLHA